METKQTAGGSQNDMDSCRCGKHEYGTVDCNICLVPNSVGYGDMGMHQETTQQKGGKHERATDDLGGTEEH